MKRTTARSGKSTCLSRKTKPKVDPDLRRRANAILRNVAMYDESTRAAVSFDLAAGSNKLAATVRRAERGEKIPGFRMLTRRPVRDVEYFDEVQEQSMRAVNALLNCQGIPTCLKRSFADALDHIAKVANVSIWPLEGTELNEQALWQAFESAEVKKAWDLPKPPIEEAQAPDDANVVDFSYWRQSHPRPIKNCVVEVQS